MMMIPRTTWDCLEDDFDLTATYSGRGMFGDQCIGLTGTAGDLMRFVVALIELDEALIADELADRVLSDNMGTETIFYFPGVTVEEDEQCAWCGQTRNPNQGAVKQRSCGDQEHADCHTSHDHGALATAKAGRGSVTP